MSSVRKSRASPSRSRRSAPTGFAVAARGLGRPVALAAGATIILLVEALGGRSAPTLAVLPARPVARVAALPRHAPYDLLAGVIVARPLFTPTRHPPGSASIEVPAARLPRLEGVIVASDRERMAILVAEGETRPFILREGAASHGLVARAITPTWIVADSAGGRVTIGLKADGARVEQAIVPVQPVMTKDPRSRAPDNQDE